MDYCKVDKSKPKGWRKMGSRKKLCIFLDTEAAPMPGACKGGNIDAHHMLCYDLGYIVAEKHGNTVYAERSFAIGDVFFQSTPDTMASAYYGDKLPQYRTNYHDGGEWTLRRWAEARAQFQQDCWDFDITEVWAFNARFDRAVTNATTYFISQGMQPWFTPYGVQWFDIWRAASVLTGTKRYVRWAILNGYTSAKGNPQTNVEVLTRYLNDDHTFTERHTALDDSRHEYAIFQRIYRYSHNATPDKMGDGWREASKVARELIASGEFTPEQVELYRAARLAVQPENL